MAEWFVTLAPEHVEFIREQHMFFVATAPADRQGYPNLSPKGYDCLEILGPAELVYADMPGSGNQTASHVAGGGRITLMFCGLGAQARILRVFGHGRRVLPDDEAWGPLLARLRPGLVTPQTRQLIAIDVDKVQTSCGYGVPAVRVRERTRYAPPVLRAGRRARRVHGQGRACPTAPGARLTRA